MGTNDNYSNIKPLIGLKVLVVSVSVRLNWTTDTFCWSICCWWQIIHIVCPKNYSAEFRITHNTFMHVALSVITDVQCKRMYSVDGDYL